MEKDSKIYVAGHRGLVGSAIWRNLEQKGYTRLIGKTHQELDLMSMEAVKDFFDRENPEYVFVAAAKVGGILANSVYRGQFIYENIMIASHLIHQSYLHGVKKLLFLGSSCIYPKLAPQPMSEDCLLTSPLEYTNEPYAISKIAGMKMCESYNLQYGTDYISVMPTNLYGPSDNFNLETSHVLPALLRKLHLGHLLEIQDWDLIRKDLAARPIEGVNQDSSEREILDILAKYGVRKENGEVSVEVWGSGKPMREFLWSEDMADACVFLMEQVSFGQLRQGMGKEVRNTHINIGTGIEHSIADTVKMISRCVGFSGKIVYNAEKPDGTPRKLLDVSRLNALGWRHRMELQEGIQALYQWYKSN